MPATFAPPAVILPVTFSLSLLCFTHVLPLAYFKGWKQKPPQVPASGGFAFLGYHPLATFTSTEDSRRSSDTSNGSSLCLYRSAQAFNSCRESNGRALQYQFQI